MKNLIIEGKKISVFFLLYTLIFFIFFKTLKFTLPFILAFIFALILKIPTTYLFKKLKINIVLSSLIINFIFFSLILLSLILFIICLIYESSSLTNNIQEFISNNSKEIQNQFNTFQFYIQKFFSNSETLNLLKEILTSSFKELTKIFISFSTLIIQQIFLFVSYLPYTIMVIIFTILSTYFLTKELVTFKFRELIYEYFSIKKSEKIFLLIIEIKKMFLNYCLSYLILILISFFISFISFSILGIKYSLLLSFLAALLDLVPVLGMPLIYFPLIFIYYINGNILTSLFLLLIYIFIFLFRQFLEPKLMSSTLGIHPLIMLICIFIGIETMGFLGVLFLIFLVLFFKILRKVNIL